MAILETHGALLGGRVRYAQPATGFRSGIEPVLLAAAVPARPGQRVLEAGTGAGAGLLCLAARVPQLVCLGVERDPELASVAGANAAANRFGDVLFVAADIAALPLSGVFDHAFANPPYHPPDSSPSPLPERDAAKRAGPNLLKLWTSILGKRLRTKGTLTLILPAPRLPECLDALSRAGLGSIAAFPLWPKAGREAGLMLIQGIKGGRGRFSLRPGMVLHEPEGRFSAQAEAVLRHGALLNLM